LRLNVFLSVIKLKTSFGLLENFLLLLTHQGIKTFFRDIQVNLWVILEEPLKEVSNPSPLSKQVPINFQPNPYPSKGLHVCHPSSNPTKAYLASSNVHHYKKTKISFNSLIQIISYFKDICHFFFFSQPSWEKCNISSPIHFLSNSINIVFKSTVKSIRLTCMSYISCGRFKTELNKR
jgi:hypothetical protein